jgi:hypothetical protein
MYFFLLLEAGSKDAVKNLHIDDDSLMRKRERERERERERRKDLTYINFSA